MKKILFILSLLILLATACTASASIDYDAGNNWITVTNENSVSMSDLLSSCPAQVTDEGNGVYKIGATIINTNSNIYLNNSDTIKWEGGAQLYYGTTGSLNIDGVNIIGWNSTGNTPATSKKRLLGPNIKFSNVTFQNISYVETTVVSNYNYKNVSMTNCTGSTNGIVIQDSENITCDGFNFSNNFDGTNEIPTDNSEGFATVNVSNSTFKNFDFNYSGRFYQESTNNTQIYNVTMNRVYNGMYFEYCNNTTVDNVSLNWTDWSSFAPQESDNMTVKNITVDNTGHNCIDMHFSRNITVENANLKVNHYNEWPTNCIEMTNSHVWTREAANIHIKNATCIDGGIICSVGAHDIFIEDVNFTNPADALIALTAGYYNITAVNITTSLNNKASIQISAVPNGDSVWYTPQNISLIDAKTYSTVFDTEDDVVKILNMYVDNSVTSNGHNVYNYINVRAENATGFPLTATVTSTNSLNIPPANGYLVNKSSFSTSVNGRTPKPSEDRSNCMALLSSRESTNTLENITATYDSNSVTLNNTNVTSVYTSNVSDINNSVVIVFNDSASPHVKGYAPDLKTSLFESGDSVKFQVWPSETVTARSWKVDGSTVSTASDSYIYTATENNATVTYEGTTADGTITKTFNFTPGLLEDVPESGLVVDFEGVPTSGTAPLTVQFTDLTKYNGVDL